MENTFLTITCPHCSHSSSTDSSKIPNRTITVTCPRCKGHFSFSKEPLPVQADFSCPKCGTAQEQASACIRCSLVFSKYVSAVDIQSQIHPNKEQIQHTNVLHDSPKPRSFKIILLLIALLTAAILYSAFFSDKNNVIAKMFIKTSWHYDLRIFKNGQTREEIENMLKKDHVQFSCRPSHGIQADDKTLCKINVEKAWGIPVVGTNLFFDSNNVLTSVNMLFAEDKQDIVNKKLAEMAIKTPYDTKDNDGEIRERWKTNTGDIITSNRPGTKGFMVYWVRGDLAPEGWKIERYSWKYDFLNFRKGQTRNDLEKMLTQDGYTYECKEQPGVAPTDTSFCLVLLREAWGIPASVAELFFEANRNLTSIIIRFSPDQYSAVIQQLDKSGPRILDNLNKAGEAKKTGTWKLANGYIHLIYEPGDGKEIMIYWLRLDLAQ